MFHSPNGYKHMSISANYYPYGMLMPGRHGQAEEGYRYGFQGQESDPEVKGEGNSVNYKYRMHDPRIGRFFAIDPLTAKYPWYTPYQFSGNKVIHCVELEGLEEAEVYNNGVSPENHVYTKQIEGLHIDVNQINHWDKKGNLQRLDIEDKEGNLLISYGDKKYINGKQIEKKYFNMKLEEGLTYVGTDYDDKPLTPPVVKLNDNSSVSSFKINEEEFDAQVTATIRSTLSGKRYRWEPNMMGLYLSINQESDLGTGTKGYQAKLMRYIDEPDATYRWENTLTMTFQSKSEYVRFVKFIMDNYNIGNHSLIYDSYTPSEVLEKLD